MSKLAIIKELTKRIFNTIARLQFKVSSGPVLDPQTTGQSQNR